MLYMQKLKQFMLYAYFIIPHNLFMKYEYLNGIKPSDFITVILVFTLINNKLTSLPTAFILLPFWYILRSIISIPNLGYISLGFGLKFFEYLIVLYTIASLDKRQKVNLLNGILVATFLFSFLEFIGLYWGHYWGGRYSAQYGGPYELGAVALLLFYVYKNHLNRIGLLIIIVISGAKASILALLISYLPFKKVNHRKILILLLIVILALLNKRIQDLILSFVTFADLNTWDLIRSVPYSYSNIDYLNNWLLREEYSQLHGIDLSTGSRIYTYILALKSLDYAGIFFGMGPGYFGFAIDSSFLRIFVESGSLGIFLFSIFYNKLFKDCQDKKIKIAIFLNILLVDIFFSARFFPLIYLCYCINFRIGKNQYES